VTYRPRRKTGPVERAVKKDLKGLPADVAAGAVASSMLTLAVRADSGALEPRDLAQVLRELRQCAQYVRDISPPAGQGDEIDELRKRREQRLAGGSG
jgi:hypothetical protein